MKVTGRRVLLILAAAAVLGVGGLILHLRSPGYRVESVLQQIREPAGDREIGRVRQWLIDLHLAAVPESLTHDEAVWDLVQIGPPAVPLLIDALDDPDINVRLVATAALGWLGDRRAVEPLMAGLDSQAPAADEATYVLRGFAAEALGRIGDVRAVPRLASILTRADSEPLGYEALSGGEDALVEPAEPAVSSVGGGLFAGVAFGGGELVKVARALARIGSASVPHVAPLLAHENRIVVANAACVLGSIGGPEAAEVLAEKIDGDAVFAHDEIAQALIRIGSEAVSPLCRHLCNTDRAVDARIRIASVLGHIKDPAAVDALMEVASGNVDASLREAARDALTLMAVEAVEPLRQRWLAAKPVAARLLGACVLRDSGCVQAVSGLAGRLEDPDASVRAGAANALGELPTWRRDHAYQWDEQASEDPEVRPAARTHLPAVRGLLADGHAPVRAAAVRTAGLMDDKEAVEALIGLLKDADAEVRTASVRSLGLLKDPKAVQPLCGLLTDSSEDFKLAVVSALVSIGHDGAVVPIRQSIAGGSGNFRYQCVRAIRQIGGAVALEALVSVLNDPFEWPITYGAVKGLEIIGDERAIGPLQALAKREPDMRVDVDAAIKAIRARAAETRPAAESGGP